MHSSNRSGWRIGIIAGVAGGLVVLLFTGLVAPGFMLSEEPRAEETLTPAPPGVGGGRMQTNIVLDFDPHETVRKVYHHIAQNSPDQACGRFTEDAARQFARSFDAAECPDAIRKLHAQVEAAPGSRNAYAEPDFHGEKGRIPDRDSIEISSCQLGVTAGPRLGMFSLQRIELDQWIITGHRLETC